MRSQVKKITDVYVFAPFIHSNGPLRKHRFLQRVQKVTSVGCNWLISILVVYRKIPKISPGAYIFQRPFLRSLFLEGLIFGGAYLWREIFVSKSIGLALLPVNGLGGSYLEGLIFRILRYFVSWLL